MSRASRRPVSTPCAADFSSSGSICPTAASASAIGAIIAAREGTDGRAGGPFRDLFEFCERIDKRIVNRRVVEALVRAGAFDSIDPDRARVLASVGIALEAADQRERAASQVSLFGETDAAALLRPDLVPAQPWDERQRLTEEKAALGFYLSGHPFRQYRAELAHFIGTTLDALQPRNEPVLLAGMVASTRTQMTRRGKMAIVMLDDGAAQVEVSVYNELFEAHRDILKEDRPLVIQGKVAKDEFTGGLRVVADKLMDMRAARERFARQLRLSMNGEASATRLRQLLEPYRNGTCPVAVRYFNGTATCEVRLGEDWCVTPEDGLIDTLSDWLKPENVEFVYA